MARARTKRKTASGGSLDLLKAIKFEFPLPACFVCSDDVKGFLMEWFRLHKKVKVVSEPYEVGGRMGLFAVAYDLYILEGVKKVKKNENVLLGKNAVVFASSAKLEKIPVFRIWDPVDEVKRKVYAYILKRFGFSSEIAEELLHASPLEVLTVAKSSEGLGDEELLALLETNQDELLEVIRMLYSVDTLKKIPLRKKFNAPVYVESWITKNTVAAVMNMALLGKGVSYTQNDLINYWKIGGENSFKVLRLKSSLRSKIKLEYSTVHSQIPFLMAIEKLGAKKLIDMALILQKRARLGNFELVFNKWLLEILNAIRDFVG